jgi:hypothetical protein
VLPEQVLQALVEFKVQLDWLDQADLMDPLDLLELQVPAVQEEPLELTDQQDLVELLEQQDLSEPLD